MSAADTTVDWPESRHGGFVTVFGCRTGGAALTVPVSRVALPVHAHQKYRNGPGSLDPVLEPGTFAVDPLPCGPP